MGGREGIGGILYSRSYGFLRHYSLGAWITETDDSSANATEPRTHRQSELVKHLNSLPAILISGDPQLRCSRGALDQGFLASIRRTSAFSDSTFSSRNPALSTFSTVRRLIWAPRSPEIVGSSRSIHWAAGS